MSYILSEAPESIYTDEDLTCTIKADGDVTGLVYSIKYMYRIGNNMTWQTIHTVSGLKRTSYTWVPKTSAFGFLMPNTTHAYLKILVTTQNGQMVHQSSKTVSLFLSKNVLAFKSAKGLRYEKIRELITFFFICICTPLYIVIYL